MYISDKTTVMCTLTWYVILLMLMYLEVPGIKMVVLTSFILSVTFGLLFLVGLSRPVADRRRIRRVIFWISSKFSNVYSFFNSEISDVYEHLTPVHQVTVSSPVLFLLENLKPTITPQAVFWTLTKKNEFDGKQFLQIAIPVDTKQSKTGLTGRALMSIPREHLIASGILQMCNRPSSSLPDNWTIKEVSSRQLLQFKSIRSWRVSGKADQVTSCPLLKEIKTQFGYSVIDCGSFLFSCKDFWQKNQIIIRDLASKGVQRLVIKAETLEESKDALTFCKNNEYSHFIYVDVGFDLFLRKFLNSDVRVCLNYVQKMRSHKGFACIGGVSLGYCEGRFTKEQQLQEFREIIPFCYNHNIPIRFHVGPQQNIHTDFLVALHYYRLMIYSICVSLKETGKFTEKDIATLVKDYGCFIMIEGDNLKYNSRVASLIKKKVIPVEKILLQSNAPHSFIGDTRKEAWHNMEDFQVNFCQKQIRYLHPESLQNMYGDDGCSMPTVLHCMIELLAGIVGIPPLSLAKTLTKNAELFYKFSDPSNLHS